MENEYINYKDSIKEMHSRMEKYNMDAISTNRDIYKSTIESVIDSFRAKDHTALLNELKALNDMESVRSTVNFGNPRLHIMQPILFGYMKRLEDILDIPFPPFGMIHTRKINASYMKKNNDKHIVMFNVSDELFTYLQLICKVVAEIIYDVDNKWIHISDSFDVSNSLVGRYSEIIFSAIAPVLNMGYVRPLDYGDELRNVAYQICEISEQFIMAHEFSHFIIDYACEVDEEIRKLRDSSPKWAEESFADYFGGILTYKVFRNEKLSDEIIAIGISTAINALSVLDLYYAIWDNTTLSEKYVPFPHRTDSLLKADLDEKSVNVIHGITNIFIHLWNISKQNILDLKELYDQCDTIEEFIDSDKYNAIIKPDGSNDQAMDIKDVYIMMASMYPKTFEDSINESLIRNMIRFKVGKTDIAYENFNSCIQIIEMIPNEICDFKYQKAVAFLYLAMIEDYKGKPQDAFETLKKAYTLMRTKLSEIELNDTEAYEKSELFKYDSSDPLKFQLSIGVVMAILRIYAEKNPEKYKKLADIMSDIGFLDDSSLPQR